MRRALVVARLGTMSKALAESYFERLGVTGLAAHTLDSPNRRMRTRLSGGAGGAGVSVISYPR